MERLISDALGWSVRIIIWIVWMPLAVAGRLYGLIRQLTAARVLATHDALPCVSCGTPVSLVGRWECGRCRFVFDGFAFTCCAICGGVPPYIPCQACGVGLKNPMHTGSRQRQR